MATHEGKRTLEDISAVQSEHTLFLARIAERLDEHTSLLMRQGETLKAIETAIQLLSGNITNMRTELLVMKGLLNERSESEHE